MKVTDADKMGDWLAQNANLTSAEGKRSTARRRGSPRNSGGTGLAVVGCGRASMQPGSDWAKSVFRGLVPNLGRRWI
jgi:hypothetical protein